MTPKQVTTAISLTGHARAQYIDAACVCHSAGTKRLLTAVIEHQPEEGVLWLDELDDDCDFDIFNQ